ISGTDTDRLKEEKERGITIELGFASLDLPDGQHIGIVDVPGHEKFVKNMVAGATGIDMVAMVIAADEGVMPQTREHMEVCTLLEIKYGLVVLTKIDLVDKEWLELVTEDIREFTEGTFLEEAPVLPVSSATNEGISELISAMGHLAEKIPENPTSGMFRLPVDRVFSMKGFGTVITGSLISGQVSTGDSVMLYPSMVDAKVRGVQVHGKSVDTAASGMRTAINFQGLEKSVVNRGDVLSPPNALKPSYMTDAIFNFLKSNEKPIKNRTRVRFHSGTSEIMGNLILLDRDELEPGETAVIQLRLDVQVALVKDDRFVIRSYSPVRTIGGGQVLNPIPAKHKRFNSEVVEGLKGIVGSDEKEIIDFHVKQNGYTGVSFNDLKLMTNLSDKKLQSAVTTLLSGNSVVQTDKENRIYIHRETFEKLEKEISDRLLAYHVSKPLKEGMPREELKSKLPRGLGSKTFNLILERMTKAGIIVYDKNMVRMTDHKVSLQVDQVDIRKKIIASYKDSGLTPPYFKDIQKKLDIESSAARDVLALLVDKEEIVKIKEDLYFHKDAVEKLKGRLVEYLMNNKEISTPQFKDMTGASRKYVIPLIEFFDAKNVTIRVGDHRRLRNG
ncbi:MAG: selenocysteine-specific translation elongation factor, partial [Deltaproteobacteria bacterium]|nr:selenocysteine-specific translation elongation factor [Deltaproteobacteria bacterium]